PGIATTIVHIKNEVYCERPALHVPASGKGDRDRLGFELGIILHSVGQEDVGMKNAQFHSCRCQAFSRNFIELPLRYVGKNQLPGCWTGLGKSKPHLNPTGKLRREIVAPCAEWIGKTLPIFGQFIERVVEPEKCYVFR